MDTDPLTGARIFKARPTTGILPFRKLAAIILAPALIVWAFFWILPLFVPILVTVILLINALVWLTIGVFVTRAAGNIHYEIEDGNLLLIGGPAHYTIPLDSIKKVYTRDLDLRFANRPKVGRVTAINVPNLALSNVSYKDIGHLKMCATSQWKDITIIETEDEKYGVTPEDREAFIEALGVKDNDWWRGTRDEGRGLAL